MKYVCGYIFVKIWFLYIVIGYLGHSCKSELARSPEERIYGGTLVPGNLVYW